MPENFAQEPAGFTVAIVALCHTQLSSSVGPCRCVGDRRVGNNRGGGCRTPSRGGPPGLRASTREACPLVADSLPARMDEGMVTGVPAVVPALTQGCSVRVEAGNRTPRV